MEKILFASALSASIVCVLHYLWFDNSDRSALSKLLLCGLLWVCTVFSYRVDVEYKDGRVKVQMGDVLDKCQ